MATLIRDNVVDKYKGVRRSHARTHSSQLFPEQRWKQPTIEGGDGNQSSSFLIMVAAHLLASSPEAGESRSLTLSLFSSLPLSLPPSILTPVQQLQCAATYDQLTSRPASSPPPRKQTLLLTADQTSPSADREGKKPTQKVRNMFAQKDTHT